MYIKKIDSRYFDSGLQSNVNKEVGTISLGILYFSFLVGALCLPSVVLNKIESHVIMSLSVICYMAYSAS